MNLLAEVNSGLLLKQLFNAVSSVTLLALVAMGLLFMQVEWLVLSLLLCLLLRVVEGRLRVPVRRRGGSVFKRRKVRRAMMCRRKGVVRGEVVEVKGMLLIFWM